MPSPRRPHSTAATPSATDTDKDDTDIPKPTWSVAPNELPPYFIKLGEWLLQDAAYETLIVSGSVLSRNQICCVSDNHIDRLSRDVIAPGTYDKPANITSATFVAFAADSFTPPARYIVNPEVVMQTEKQLLDAG